MPKEVIKKNIKIKPRNHVILKVLEMRQSGAGSHSKPEKSLRQKAKVDLKKHNY